MLNLKTYTIITYCLKSNALIFTRWAVTTRTCLVSLYNHLLSVTLASCLPSPRNVTVHHPRWSA